MEPLLIYPGQTCYEAAGFHCTGDLDGHNLHCVQCHAYAEQKMTRETITVYMHPKH